MTRLTIVILAAALLGAAALSVAHAQEPTGSISARVVIEGQPPVPYDDVFSVVSADTPQPMFSEQLVLVQFDDQGNFTVSGLGDGDYLLVLPPWWSFVDAVTEEVLIAPPDGTDITLALSAIRVTVANGQAVVGIQIVVRPAEPPPVVFDSPPLSPPGQLSPALSLGAPTTGAGPGGADGATGRIVAWLAVAATLLLAGGVALRARGSRRA